MSRSGSQAMRIGIDLGGTKIEGIVLSSDGEILVRERVSTPQGDYPATLDEIAKLVSRLEDQVDKNNLPVGIGTPGSISKKTGLMRNCNSTCLNHQPFLQDIQNKLERDITIANDANCFALSEAVDGAGKQSDVVFGVILGTGVGGGVVINKQLLNGVNAIAGEWGHSPLPRNAPRIKVNAGCTEKEYQRPCYCGKTDCIETYLSGPGLALSYFEHTQKQLTAEQIAKLAEQGDSEAQTVLAVYIEQLAASLATVINMLDPEVIVLGGGLSNIQSIYRQLPEALARYVFSDHIATQVLPPKYGDSSGVRGAAWLVRTSMVCEE